MRIAAQHVIMELLNTAVKNIKAPFALMSKIAMKNIRVIGGRKSSKTVSACGAPMGDVYSRIKTAIDTDTDTPALEESLGRFYLTGLPGRTIMEYRTLFDGLFGYFLSLGNGAFGEIKKAISSAFTRYGPEENDKDPEVIAYRNDLLTLPLVDPGDGDDASLNSDTKDGKTSGVLPIHRLGDLCSVPVDTKQDPTSAYRHLKRYTSAVASEEGAASAAAQKVFIYG